MRDVSQGHFPIASPDQSPGWQKRPDMMRFPAPNVNSAEMSTGESRTPLGSWRPKGIRKALHELSSHRTALRPVLEGESSQCWRNQVSALILLKNEVRIIRKYIIFRMEIRRKVLSVNWICLMNCKKFHIKKYHYKKLFFFVAIYFQTVHPIRRLSGFGCDFWSVCSGPEKRGKR